MTPQMGQPNAYAQLFSAQRGAQQPQGMPPMRPMTGPPPTGQPGPQQGMNPYAAMLAQAQGPRPQFPGMAPRPPMGPPMGGPQMGQGMQPQGMPAWAQQRMQLAQQMAQQPRPQMPQMPPQAQGVPQRPPQWNPMQR